jgi:tRNA wybutosine-synthesizing protein 1
MNQKVNNKTTGLFALAGYIMLVLVVGACNKAPENQTKQTIKKAEPDFIEVKSYMCVGYSRKRLTLDNMLSQQEIIDFAKKIGDEAGYDLADSVDLSRVALLKKK